MSTNTTQRRPPAGLAGAARAGALGLVGAGAAAVAGLVLNVVVGRAFGTTGAGLFYVVVGLVTVIATVSKLGADTGLVWALSRATALGRQRDARLTLRTALLPCLATSAAAAVALLVLAPQVARWTAADHADEVTTLLRTAAPFLLLGAPVAVLAAALRGAGDLKGFTAVQNLLVPGLRPLLVVAAAGAGAGLLGAVVAWNATLVIGLTVAVLLVARRVRTLERSAPGGAQQRPAPDVRREFWGFSAPRSVSALLEVVVVWADVLIVAALASPAEAGVYAAASRFITTGTLVEAALRLALAPRLSAMLATGDLTGASELRTEATRWLVLGSWPLYLCLGLYGPEVLSVFGEGFASGAPALAVLAGAMLVAMAVGNSQTVLLMSGLSRTQMVVKLVTVTICLGLDVVLVPRWGMTGAAVAWAVAVVVDALVVLALVRWKVGLSTPARGVLLAAAVPLLAFTPLGAAHALWFRGHGSALAAAVAAALGAVLYGGALWLGRHRLGLVDLVAALRPAGRSSSVKSPRSAPSDL